MKVDVRKATKQERNWIYALFICNGYNPCDSVFWGMMKSKPLSDASWEYILPSMIEDLGEVVDVPDNFVSH